MCQYFHFQALRGCSINTYAVGRDSLLVERRTRHRKVVSSNPGWSGGRILFSKAKFVCRLLFGVRSGPVLPQWHVQDPSHSVKCAVGRFHLTTHTPLTQRSRSGLTMPLSRHVREPIRKQLTRNSSKSSQLAEPLWTDSGIKSGISLCELISTLKRAQAGNELSNILPKSSHTRKIHHVS